MIERQPNSQPLSEALVQPITSDAVSDAASPQTPDQFLLFDPRTEAQRKNAEIILQGVEKLIEDPKSYFYFRFRFPKYSVNNTILIWMQFPDATMCASRENWAKRGRTVAPDELRNGIKIYYPLFRYQKRINPDTGEEETRKTLSGFGVGNTWDVSQTEGDPLPQEPTIIESLGITEGSKDVDRRLASYLIGEGVRLARMPLGTARGVYSPPEKAIALNLTLPYGDILTTKTLMHEAAHYAGDHRGGDKRDLETVAELGAVIPMMYFGMQTDEYSFPYIAHWAEDMSRLRQNLGAAQKISTQLITAVEGEDPGAMQVWS